MNSRRLLLYLPPFIVLAVLNSGGYRYGASDQAFYLPVIFAKLDPGLYVRDAAVIAAQARLTIYDEAMAAIVRATGVSIPVLFAVLHVISLVLVATGVWLVAKRIYRTEWACVALLAAMTLRHAIARSGTNTLEGYFHPRQLAFGIGIVAIALFLRKRDAAAAATIAAAAVLHPTAAVWFAIWLAAAIAIANPQMRRLMLVAAVPVGILSVWALVAGPLAGRLSVMDDEWRRMLSTKEYLFILEWPAHAWILNLGYLPLIGWLYVRRQRSGLVGDRERALVLGSSALAAVFVVFLVLQAMHIVLSFQLQPARLFLMFDLLATVYAVWALAEGTCQGDVLHGLHGGARCRGAPHPGVLGCACGVRQRRDREAGDPGHDSG